MKKLFIKFFLLHCILFLTGYNTLQAHVTQHEVCDATINKLQRNDFGKFEDANKCYKAATNFDLFDNEENKEKLRSIVDIDEEESVSSHKKKTGLNNYFTSVFCVQATADTTQSIKNGLSEIDHFCYFLSEKWFIVFRVIRI